MNSKKIIITLIVLIALVTLLGLGTTAFFVIRYHFNTDTKEVEEKEEEKEEKPKEEEPEKPKEFSYIPIMYKVCDSDSCIHVLGSMHMGDEKITKYDKKVLDIYSESEAVAVELSDEEMNKMHIEDYIYKDGTTLDNHISPDLKKKLEDFSAKHDLYKYNVYKYYNVAINSTLIENVMYQEVGFTTQGADSYFTDLAAQDGKEIISIEKIEDQLKPLVEYSDEFYAKQMESSLDNYNAAITSTKLLYKIYLDGNDALMAKAISSSYSSYETEEEKKYVEDLIIKRNDTMTNAAKDYLAQNKKVLLIVGAAHVVYEENGIIPELSKDQNYTIERIK